MSTSEAVESIDERLEVKPSPDTKAFELMVRGRALSSGEKFSQEAFNLLSKAIKLNPHLTEAWVELTKCYQRKPDIDGAIACLENALKYCDSEKPNKVILRKLSTCIRQKDFDNQESKIAALLRSLELSKQALKSDLYDEENYYNLAKAYMCLFFVTECVDHQLINLSHAAYKKALTLSNDNAVKRRLVGNPDVVTSTNVEKNESEEEVKPFIEQSDFLFNYSTVLLYLQKFQKALEYLRLAIKLDPDWNEPKTLEESLIDYIKQIYLMLNELNKNNKRVVRRYTKVIETLKNVSKIESIIRLDQQRLQKSPDIDIETIDLKRLEATMESSGQDERLSATSETKQVDLTRVVRLLHLKLINTINYNQAMYLTFIAIDVDYSLIVVTIHNLAASRCPTPKDVVTLVNPKIEQIKIDNIKNINQVISFQRINVREFKDLYVNGFRITRDQVSKPQFRVSVLP